MADDRAVRWLDGNCGLGPPPNDGGGRYLGGCRRYRTLDALDVVRVQVKGYACHEGNYALSNILSGARYQERLEAQEKSGSR